MNLYRHKLNKRLYTVEHLILDIHHLNGNAFAGIYATPYKWDGDTISYVKGGNQKDFDPEKFFQENFDRVAELRHEK